jgi:tetratricopeptide (TPR) repeat protein
MKRSFAVLFICGQLVLMSRWGYLPNSYFVRSQDVGTNPSTKKVQIDWHAKLANLQKQLAREPHSAFLHGQAAVAYDALDDVPSFEREIQLAMDLDKKSATYCYWAYAVYKRRNLRERAILALNRALQIDPNNPLGHYERAAIFENEKKWGDALAEYEFTKTLLRTAKHNTDGLSYSEWSYMDPRGGSYDVTYLKTHIDDDLARSRAAASTDR